MGALALAVIAPALEPAEHAAEAMPAAPLPATPEAPGLELPDFNTGLLQARMAAQQRASRSMVRRPAVLRPNVRPVASPALRRPVAVQPGRAARVAAQPGRAARVIASRAAGGVARKAAVSRNRIAVQQKRVTVAKRGALSVRKTTRSTTVRRLRSAGAGAGRNMSAVIAFARSQVGKRYVRGGEGPHGFDCSGFTKRAYARVGMSLPHSSGGQARRARTVSRSQARPGDLVVGPGHVGIYMGRGMMIDAGNSRTGVVYRKVYRGLRVARVN
ncbi:NlpC/P60 family protein [Actinoplanes sp. NPDC023714]|uniref:C40 family peptidase n=1 Tax=Actinoplanes sp. NPDC023714 TaxID=3154322 RepID=UPI0033D05925